LGRLAPKKRLDLLIDAAPALFDDYPNASIIVAGDGNPEVVASLRERASRLDGRFRFVGRVEGDLKSALLRRADVFVLPSENENFGVAVAESLMAGTPVVTTAYVATHRYVSAASAGAIFQDLNAVEVVRAVHLVLDGDSEDLHERALRAGRSLTWEASAKRLEALFHGLTDSVEEADGCTGHRYP
jgi:glycosyltransferase involved in cell wall biosynthesis